MANNNRLLTDFQLMQRAMRLELIKQLRYTGLKQHVFDTIITYIMNNMSVQRQRGGEYPRERWGSFLGYLQKQDQALPVNCYYLLVRP